MKISPAVDSIPLASILSKGIAVEAYGDNFRVGGTLVIDPQIVDPPGSTPDVAWLGNPGGNLLWLGIRGYVIPPSEL